MFQTICMINGLPLNRAIRDEDGKIQEVIAGDFFIISEILILNNYILAYV